MNGPTKPKVKNAKKDENSCIATMLNVCLCVFIIINFAALLLFLLNATTFPILMPFQIFVFLHF